MPSLKPTSKFPIHPGTKGSLTFISFLRTSSTVGEGRASGGRGFKARPGPKVLVSYLFKADVRTLFGLIAQLVLAND